MSADDVLPTIREMRDAGDFDGLLAVARAAGDAGALLRGAERRMCVECGRPARAKGRKKSGLQTWDRRCGSCHKRRRRVGVQDGSLVMPMGVLGSPRATGRVAYKFMRRLFREAKDRRGVWSKGNDSIRCRKCGHVPIVPSVLEVDHIDGNPKNGDPANLQTLCANCHREKTYLLDMPAWGAARKTTSVNTTA